MDQIANVAVQQGAAAPQTTLRGMLGMAQGGQMGGDGFAAIFQQLMGGDMEAGDLAAMLMQMTGRLQKDAEEMGAKMAAEMVNSMPFLSPNVIASLVQMSWSGDQAKLEALADSMQNPDGMSKLPAYLLQREGVLPEGEENGEAQPISQENKDFLDALTGAWASRAEARSKPITTEVDQSAIRAAKELLSRNSKGGKTEADTETLDVESLQADVNARRFMPAVSSAAQEPLPQVPTGEELAQQVKTGILENAAKGKNEFVVRLKPEGIGEIVVKLSEDKEKISLSIITSSPQTARLISNEVAALQNALKPLHAEVQEITTVAGSEQAAQYSAQGQMTDQGRQSHRQDTPQGHRHGVAAVSMEDSFEDAVEAGNVIGDDGLDTYI